MSPGVGEAGSVVLRTVVNASRPAAIAYHGGGRGVCPAEAGAVRVLVWCSMAGATRRRDRRDVTCAEDGDGVGGGAVDRGWDV